MSTEVSTLDLATVMSIATRFVTTEYASVTRDGRPVTWPVTPYPSADGRTIRVSTGLTYPLKAERARSNPKVSLSFSFPRGSGLVDPPTLLVEGLATVHDADMHATSAEYLRASMERFPDYFRKIPVSQWRRMDWYWTRIWIDVTPIRVRWWPKGDLRVEPLCWTSPPTEIDPSDPAPAGASSGSWARAGGDWRDRAGGALARLGAPVVTTIGPDGWPLPWRATEAREDAAGFTLDAPAGISPTPGPAFLTMHQHRDVFDGQENLGLAGDLEPAGDAWLFRAQRALADFGLPRNPLKALLTMRGAARALRPRLHHEATRRGQTVPRYDDLNVPRPTRRPSG
jgi:hypothetical protein